MMGAVPMCSHHGTPLALKAEELSRPVTDMFRDPQRNITPRNRTVLVDWLLDVAQEFALRGDTLFLAVDLLDRHLAREDESTAWLQLLGSACIWTAAKIEDAFSPSAHDMVGLTGHMYTTAQLVNMERHLLLVLQHSLVRPNAYTFLSTLLHISHAEELYGCPPTSPPGACPNCYWEACEQQANAVAMSPSPSKCEPADSSPTSLASQTLTAMQLPDGEAQGCAARPSGEAVAVQHALRDLQVTGAAADGHQPRLPCGLPDCGLLQQQRHRPGPEQAHQRTSQPQQQNPKALPSAAACGAIISTHVRALQCNGGTVQNGYATSQLPHSGCITKQQGSDHMDTGVAKEEDEEWCPVPSQQRTRLTGVAARHGQENNNHMQLVYLARMVAEACLLDHKMLRFMPSQVAAACLMVARSMLGKPVWSPTLAQQSGVNGPHSLAPCVVAVADAYAHARQDRELLSLQARYGSRRMHVFSLEPTPEALQLVASCRAAAATAHPSAPPATANQTDSADHALSTLRPTPARLHATTGHTATDGLASDLRCEEAFADGWGVLDGNASGFWPDRSSHVKLEDDEALHDWLDLVHGEAVDALQLHCRAYASDPTVGLSLQPHSRRLHKEPVCEALKASALASTYIKCLAVAVPALLPRGPAENFLLDSLTLAKSCGQVGKRSHVTGLGDADTPSLPEFRVGQVSPRSALTFDSGQPSSWGGSTLTGCSLKESNSSVTRSGLARGVRACTDEPAVGPMRIGPAPGVLLPAWRPAMAHHGG